MKPSIPELGTVTRLDGGNALIRMKHEGSCYKCGAAAIGLCKGGLMQELTARNPLHARVGDTVKIGLVRRVQYAGYLLAFVVPAAALLAGMVAGHLIGDRLGLTWLDITAGFVSMIVAAFVSLRRLKRLDGNHQIEIVQVLSDPWTPGSESCGDRSVAEYYRSSY